MCDAPEFHQGPRPLVVDLQARSSFSPRCIRFFAGQGDPHALEPAVLGCLNGGRPGSSPQRRVCDGIDLFDSPIANSGCRPTRKPPFPKFISRRCSFGVSLRSEMITVSFENQTKFAMSQIFSRNRFGKGLLIGGR